MTIIWNVFAVIKERGFKMDVVVTVFIHVLVCVTCGMAMGMCASTYVKATPFLGSLFCGGFAGLLHILLSKISGE